MPETIDKPATYADIEALPPNVVGEILYDRLVQHPRPGPKHVHVSSSLGDELVGPFQKGRGGPGGWRIYDEPELHLGGHILVPDLAGWRLERMPQLPETAYFDVVPDWVCECLSPATQRTDKGDKRLIYAELGIPNLWYLDPPARTLEVFHLTRGEWVLTHTFFDDDDVAAPPFDAVTFSLGALWPDAPETSSET
jgi:Uma2 family endonuclease